MVGNRAAKSIPCSLLFYFPFVLKLFIISLFLHTKSAQLAHLINPINLNFMEAQKMFGNLN